MSNKKEHTAKFKGSQQKLQQRTAETNNSIKC